MNKTSFLIFCLFLIASNVCYAHKDFSFVAHGDTAYSKKSYAQYNALIDRINQIKPAFTIHVGDTQGHQPCDHTSIERVDNFFKRFDHPLFYTPGDNEWTDCSASNKGAAFFSKEDPSTIKFNALSNIRSAFFSEAKSLGGKTLPRIRQSDLSKYKDMDENSFWEYEGVLFSTIHVAGSMDGRKWGNAALLEDSKQRVKANVAWLKYLQLMAKKKDPRALVIALHAELFEPGEAHEKFKPFAAKNIRDGADGPYFPIVKAISELSKTFSKPILVIHGDYHVYIVDKPFATEKQGGNITRLQVFGEPVIGAVKIDVSSKNEDVFSIAPLQ